MTPETPPPTSPAPKSPAESPIRLMLIGLIIGVPAALVAAGFLALVHVMETWFWSDLPDALGVSSPPWYLIVGLPVVGACFVIVARRFLPGDGGHAPLLGFAGGPVGLSAAPGVALAALGTLAFGVVLGPEGPLIALGAIVGLGVTYLVRRVDETHPSIPLAGSFAAIAALFGGPVVAGVMMVEAGLAAGTAIIPALVPGFVAAAVGYCLFVGFGHWGGLHMQAIAVPGLPLYKGTDLRDLLLAVVIGVLAAVLIHVVRTGATAVAERGVPRLGMPVMLLVGGLGVGLVALVARQLGANSQDVLFSGQQSIPALVAEQSTKIIVILLVAKAIAYAVSLGAGFRGGPVFPSIFLGVAVAMLAVVLFGMSPTAGLAIGSAAGMAATTRLLLTSCVFATLLVGPAGADAVPAAVLAACAAWVAMLALTRQPSPTQAGEGAA